MAAPASTGSSPVVSFWLCRFLALLAFTVAARAAGWDPVSKEELAESKPKVDPDAGAEILYRKVIMDHSSDAWWVDSHYVRAKIFTSKGVNDFAKIDIEYGSASQVTGVAARTIKPDGTTEDLNPKDIYDREIIKFGSERRKVKSFALPALEPGVVVEYRYTVKNNDPGYFTRIYFQSAFPARKVTFKLHIEPPVRMNQFNCSSQPLERGLDGY